MFAGDDGNLGYRVSGLGDMNNDGYSDFLLSSFNYYTKTWRVYFQYGAPSPSLSLSDIIFSTTISESNFGFSVSRAGD